MSLTTPCPTPDALHAWLGTHLGIHVPRRPVCPNHDAPFDYLCRAYFEPAEDLVVWAPRGGGKTRLAAAATFLELLHKPAIAIRILGGSLDQSLRMWEHLMPDLLEHAEDLIEAKPRARSVKLTNASTAAILTQSQRAVRGLRVQKLRCDEVELFDPPIWEAAQLITRSLPADPDTGRPPIRAAIEAISTLHRPFGLMQRIVEQAGQTGVKVLRWCLMEVLARCEPERECAVCPLFDECQGVAKHRCDGFLGIDDAIRMKRRVSRQMWETEMLCLRPSVQGLVFPDFDPAVHVVDLPAPAGEISLAIDFGFKGPFVCLWISTAEDGITRIFDEYLCSGQTVARHIEQIHQRPWPRARRLACDPAGNGPNDQTAQSNVALLRAAGYIVRTRPSKILDGVEKIRAALRPAAGPPRLIIHPRCRHLITAFQRYHYLETGGETPHKDGDHDHPIDALRYHFVNLSHAPDHPRPY